MRTFNCNSCGKEIVQDGSEFIQTFGNVYHLSCEHTLQKRALRKYVTSVDDAAWEDEEVIEDIKQYALFRMAADICFRRGWQREEEALYQTLNEGYPTEAMSINIIIKDKELRRNLQ
jgi:hypothetical protein